MNSQDIHRELKARPRKDWEPYLISVGFPPEHAVDYAADLEFQLKKLRKPVN